MYSIKVPSPHPAFETYAATITPKAGMCRLTGIGKTFSNDRYGNQLRQEFASVRDQLKSVYGSSNLFDYLAPGALWKGPNEWVMALLQHERSYQSSWDAKSKASLKDGITEILLTAQALSGDSSFITLQYRFSNWDPCQKEIKDSAAGAL